jgi:hypothetical protein
MTFRGLSVGEVGRNSEVRPTNQPSPTGEGEDVPFNEFAWYLESLDSQHAKMIQLFY